MSILTSRTLPLPPAGPAFPAAASACLHGPHHVAQKSTTTGTVIDALITSSAKLRRSPSLIAAGGAAAARPAFPGSMIISAFARPSLRNGLAIDGSNRGSLKGLRRRAAAPDRAPLDGQARPQSSTISGSRPQERMKASRPSGVMAVVAVLVSGWKLSTGRPSSRRRAPRVTAASVIVDQGERRHRARLDAEHGAQHLGAGERQRRRTDPVRAAPSGRPPGPPWRRPARAPPSCP